MKLMAIVLAAGQGKRMKSKLYKVLHSVCGKPMVGHVLDTLEHIQTEKTIVIVGHGAEAVKGYLGDRAEYALQEQQLGTGHAVLQAKDVIGAEDGVTFVVCGDTPLVRPETLEKMLRLHREKGAAGTILTAEMTDATGYGRIIRGEGGRVDRIVEQKDCSPEEAAVREINTGTYCFDNRKLFEALENVKNENAQGEYYLTDVVGILKNAGEIVEAYCTPDEAEAIGVNDRIALSEAETLMRQRINRGHMVGGVTFIDPSQTYIEKDVVIGPDTVLYPGTALRGKTVIGSECVIGPNTEICDSTLGDEVTVKQSVLQDSKVGSHANVGPFAYLRPGTDLGKHVKIGDFVEIKNAKLGEGSKVSHLSYVGDAVIGKNVNFGCGAITVNYDGFNKSLTEVGDDAFIGSNVNLIAPVKVGDGAYVVAGSTITHNVEDNDLAIARERQTNKKGYADRIRSKMKAKKENKHS
ncbi:bifunctional UDP-N-acetylglucosamine diphosphorylase/glucosamine-1-phosphate N-acetyltransferase GlmU [Paenibacillus chitinolyticus]|uniref:bifunctional UDP-N-acetylglucosamine diphosphorylase/glucosamine-1-phosphate N-acetyltransferase GlmU n=1 Tax=Paenibacillus chitinolyticus TaxID=79263 RepID=UPI002DBC2AC8|nr:bifunctional UDP-N-acetylglucosamine diphosphorylase/glucosamine-1-phosphate N-acetyltransferase GlmU [Paenibacillus chitinolyticus]MEC0248379.1 bifunctional UDP-N-acetylglucosamine diphosphorylase/glucosamine-1-phosphate N-acetyltransferase GlmU [Paenibacillus chitinolyticus]